MNLWTMSRETRKSPLNVVDLASKLTVIVMKRPVIVRSDPRCGDNIKFKQSIRTQIRWFDPPVPFPRAFFHSFISRERIISDFFVYLFLPLEANNSEIMDTRSTGPWIILLVDPVAGLFPQLPPVTAQFWRLNQCKN
jgi:hypothetical protein